MLTGYKTDLLKENATEGGLHHREEQFAPLDCLVEYRSAAEAGGIQYRDCKIDYTACPNQNCIKKLL